jgi:hypothetical protein
MFVQNGFAEPEIAAGHIVGAVYSIATTQSPAVSLVVLKARLLKPGAKPQHFRPGLHFAIANGWLTLDAEGIFVQLTKAGLLIFK